MFSFIMFMLGFVISPFLLAFVAFETPVFEYLEKIPCYLGLHKWSNMPRNIKRTGYYDSNNVLVAMIGSIGAETTGEIECLRCPKKKRIKIR